VYCSKCGAPNVDGAAFCSKCGNPLPNSASAPAQPSQSNSAAPPQGQRGDRKNPIIAAVLNLFIGLGYLYLGYKKVLSLPTIIFVLVVLVINILLGVYTFGLIPLLLAIILAYDGYVKAKGEKGFIDTEPAMLYQ
jgi:uncharacterized membrane protein YvbJ